MIKEKKIYYDIRVENTISNLKKRQFDAIYFDTKEKAKEFFLSKIDKNTTIGYGGSRTLEQMKLIEYLRNNGYNLMDRNKPGISKEEKEKIQREIFFADVFITSSNAISEDGCLFNIGLYGNRVAAISFGPKKVYVFAGINKLALNYDDAMNRAINKASVMNAIRFNINAPCTKGGICYDCVSPERICASYVITKWCQPEKRITVILIGEELGF